MTLVNTPRHDALHLWLYDERNRFKMLEKVASKKKFELDKDSYTSSLEIEKPIFSPQTQTRRFIIDSIIDISKHCPTNGGYRLVSAKSFSGKEIRVASGSVHRRVIADLKPTLNSISSAIGQLKSYQHHLQYRRWDSNIQKERQSLPDMVLLTLDYNWTKYSDMLLSQGIIIYHVNPKEIKC